MRTYTAYSIGTGFVLAVVLVLAYFIDPAGERKSILLVAVGFALGWLSATIARSVYPPPKKHRSG